MAKSLPAKLISETITVEFNFLGVLEWGETISSATVTVEVFSGQDYAPSLLLDGSCSVSSPLVSQKIQQGMPGVIYLVIATAEGSSGTSYVMVKKLAVLSDDSAFGPPSFVSLTGDLPDGTSKVPYSASLLISGGFPPYEFDDIIAGTAPGWMSFNVVDNQLICAGTPPEQPTTQYLFTPQIRDGVNNLANAPQDVTFVHLIISGNLPDGRIGDAISGQYDQVNGYGTVTFAVTSGTFPPGVTLNSDGTYSGSFSQGGTFVWEVTGTDSVGNTYTIQDTSAVQSLVWWLTTGNATVTGGRARVWISLDPFTWTNPPSSRSPNINPVYGPVSLTDARLIWGGTSYERITDYNSSPLTPNIITVSGLGTPRFVRYFDSSNVVFTSGQSGPYWLSTDQAQTWTQYESPNSSGSDVVDMVQMNSGRWVIVTYGAPRRAWYSDQSVPTEWNFGDTVGTGDILVSSGTAVVLWDGDYFSRTTDGINWELEPSGLGLGAGPGAYGGGVFIFGGASGKIVRSTNNGATFEEVSLPAGTTVSSAQFIGGMFVLTVAATFSGDYLMISQDLGITWQIVNLPYDRTTATEGDCRIGAAYEMI